MNGVPTLKTEVRVAIRIAALIFTVIRKKPARGPLGEGGEGGGTFFDVGQYSTMLNQHSEFAFPEALN